MYSKKAILFMVVLLSCSAGAFAQDEGVIWGSWYSPGNLVLTARGAYEIPSVYSGGLGVYPGAEIIVHKYRFEDVAPLDFGIAARGHLGISFDDDLDNTLTAGIGGLATMHIGFRGLDFIDPVILGNLEYFAEIGAGVDLIQYDQDNSALRFCTMTGFTYFLNESTAVSAGYNRWGDISGGFIGVQLKVGPSPNVDSTQLAADIRSSGRIMMTQVYVSQFYALYWYAFAAGGFYFDDSTYEVGQGTIWSLTSADDEQEVRLEKALLSVEEDGSKWWRVGFTQEGSELIYEYLISPEYQLIKMRFKDVGQNKVGEYEFESEAGQHGPTAVEAITREEYAEYRTGTESLRVGAGTFECDLLEYSYSADADTWNYNWWVSEEVPGSLVKFYWVLNEGEEWMQGELAEITSGNTPVLQ